MSTVLDWVGVFFLSAILWIFLAGPLDNFF